MRYSEAVSSDPEIMSGALCFTGTRVPVRNLFNYLLGGHDIAYFLEGFPGVEKQQILVVLEQGIDILEVGTTSQKYVPSQS